MTSPDRILLLSGMGADARLFHSIDVPGLEVVTPDHIAPVANETLVDYVSRVANELAVGEGDVIGGASFGGMLAAQIASTRSVAGLVLLGSCLRSRELPKSYAWFERVSRWLPDSVMRVRRWRWQIRYRLGPLTPESEACIVEMAEAFPTDRLRAFGRMIIKWPGVERPKCPLLSIHGKRDRIIPLRCAEPGVVLHDAGHAFTLTHPAETNSAIAEFLDRLKDAAA